MPGIRVVPLDQPTNSTNSTTMPTPPPRLVQLAATLQQHRQLLEDQEAELKIKTQALRKFEKTLDFRTKSLGGLFGGNKAKAKQRKADEKEIKALKTTCKHSSSTVNDLVARQLGDTATFCQATDEEYQDWAKQKRELVLQNARQTPWTVCSH
eukprot:TRINITY_DN60071_c0_g1_i2.p1 TRINITY_DN60071_c0_g1~~TRINITY_DN60071_c0_g1_i2.p1  ORF type:complete len:153 (-),score=16.17 TRINITY_DN60071_c0_g1_i2:112-570(-)